MLQRVVRTAVAAAALMASAAIVQPRVARAATITGASIESRDGAVELRFAVQGSGLGWSLSIHGQQLWIDLARVRMEIPPRPLFGQEIEPVTMVRAIGASGGIGGTGRITVEVSGRIDYAIARLPQELVLRVAPAGKVTNLAAPLLRRMERRRFATQAVPAQPASSSNPGAIGNNPAGFRNGGTNATAASDGVSRAPARTFNDNAIARATPPENGGPPRIASRETADAAVMPAGERPLVVIDPGHGGHDPGTEAAGDVAEKEVALQIATRVRNALVADGIDARMTRSDDTFLTLAERTQIANSNRADLFVSIHLNSSPDAATTGIETYYLNNTTDRATIRLARMENGVAGGYGAPGEPNLNYILTDLRQQDKANESASLARMIDAEAVADIDASMGLRVNELGAKQGPFYVLVGALMPSVLVECGFLSNPGEARLLEAPQYQQALADGIARAVVHYFKADAAVGNL
jgi:N-acetylmuramoyl-L-alanine amidase